MDVFYTDVRPALAEWRESRGFAADPWKPSPPRATSRRSPRTASAASRPAGARNKRQWADPERIRPLAFVPIARRSDIERQVVHLRDSAAGRREARCSGAGARRRCRRTDAALPVAVDRDELPSSMPMAPRKWRRRLFISSALAGTEHHPTWPPTICACSSKPSRARSGQMVPRPVSRELVERLDVVRCDERRPGELAVGGAEDREERRNRGVVGEGGNAASARIRDLEVRAWAVEAHGVTDLERTEPRHHGAFDAVEHDVDIDRLGFVRRRPHGVDARDVAEVGPKVEAQRDVRAVPRVVVAEPRNV